MAEPVIFTALAGNEHAGMRVDKFLATLLPSLSRSRVQALIEEGMVGVAGRIIKDASAKVKPGECFDIRVPEAVPTHLVSRAAPLDIQFEDEHMLVINKAAGMTVHPAPGHHDDTLVNALLAHCGGSLSGIGGVARPGIVHRLDKDTSGLMVVAKHDAAHMALSAQLADRTLKRVYQAMVWGVPAPKKGMIEGNIGRSPRNRQKMAVLKKGGKEALTHYETKETFIIGEEARPLSSLVECRLETGRTHQIRVHLTHIGHALLGDPVYGQSTRKVVEREKKHLPAAAAAALLVFERQALHACQIGFIHPVKKKMMEFKVDAPSDMQQLMLSLRGCKA